MRRGLTLIEMLILLALTAVLVGMLLPLLSKTRAVGDSILCGSNLRQIGQMHRFDPYRQQAWGSSAYDVGYSGNPAPAHGYGGQGGGNNEQPMRADRLRGDVGGAFEGTVFFNQRMESQALDQPEYWTLICPVAFREGVNSYGMSHYAVRASFTDPNFSQEGTKVIMGCSNWKVVAVVGEFAPRHLQKTNYYFSDDHVDLRGLGEFSERQRILTSNRRSTGTSVP